jgi:hypothetical protein
MSSTFQVVWNLSVIGSSAPARAIVGKPSAAAACSRCSRDESATRGLA